MNAAELDERILAALDTAPEGLTPPAIGSTTRPEHETRKTHMAQVYGRLKRLDARGLIEERKDWTTVYLTLDPKARARWEAERTEVEARAATVLATAQRLGHAPSEADDHDRALTLRRFTASTVTITATQYLELADRAERRSGGAAEPGARQCEHPRAIEQWFRARVDLDAVEVEHFWTITLDARNRPIALHLVHKGCLNRVEIHPREVFCEAVRDRARAVIVLHNHPSGDETPSESDFLLTERLVSGGALLGIPVLDHLVVTRTTYYSFVADGLMPKPDQ